MKFEGLSFAKCKTRIGQFSLPSPPSPFFLLHISISVYVSVYIRKSISCMQIHMHMYTCIIEHIIHTHRNWCPNTPLQIQDLSLSSLQAANWPFFGFLSPQAPLPHLSFSRWHVRVCVCIYTWMHIMHTICMYLYMYVHAQLCVLYVRIYIYMYIHNCVYYTRVNKLMPAYTSGNLGHIWCQFASDKLACIILLSKACSFAVIWSITTPSLSRSSMSHSTSITVQCSFHLTRILHIAVFGVTDVAANVECFQHL